MITILTTKVIKKLEIVSIFVKSDGEDYHDKERKKTSSPGKGIARPASTMNSSAGLDGDSSPIASIKAGSSTMAAAILFRAHHTRTSIIGAEICRGPRLFWILQSLDEQDASFA